MELNDWLYFGRYYPSDAYDAPGANNKIDFLDAWMAHDDDYVDLAYTSMGHIVLNQTENIYLDIDFDHNTGYQFGAIGAEFLIQGSQFYKYNGNGTNFEWTLIGSTEVSNYGCQAEMRFPRSWIGNPQMIRFVMQADNTVFGGNIVDYFPDNGHLSVLHGGTYFCYRFMSAKAIKNVQPIAVDNVYNTNQNQSIQVIIHKFDADGDPLTFHFVSNVSHGTLVSDGPDAFIYTPAPGFVGTDSFQFFVNDGYVNSRTATITINVHAIVPPPGPGGDPCLSNPLTAPIKLDGKTSADWASFTSFGVDPVEHAGNAASRADWVQGWMAHSTNNLYIAYESAKTFAPNYFNWGFTIYLDTDVDNLTGFRGAQVEFAVGADYMIQSKHLFKYTGSGTDWSWTYVATLVAGIYDKTAEMAVPRSLIGNTTRLHTIFVGTNEAFVDGQGTDYYPDDAVSARTCFCYDLSTPSLLKKTSQRGIPAPNTLYVPAEMSYQKTDILLNAPKAIQNRSFAETNNADPILSIDWTAPLGTPVTIQYSTDLENWKDLLTYDTQSGNTAFVASDVEDESHAYFRTVQFGKTESVSDR